MTTRYVSLGAVTKRTRTHTLTSLLTQLVQHHGTQRDAAAALGVSQATFSRWLGGSRSPKRASRQRLIALGADPRTL